MLRHARWLVLAVLFVLPALGLPGPAKGIVRQSKVKIPAGAPGIIEIKSLAFTGGQRASIILVGDHDPVVNLGIKVYDEDDRLVAADRGKGDFAAVTWYPPTTANYRIELENHQNLHNLCYLVIK